MKNTKVSVPVEALFEEAENFLAQAKETYEGGGGKIEEAMCELDDAIEMIQKILQHMDTELQDD